MSEPRSRGITGNRLWATAVRILLHRIPYSHERHTVQSVLLFETIIVSHLIATVQAPKRDSLILIQSP